MPYLTERFLQDRPKFLSVGEPKLLAARYALCYAFDARKSTDFEAVNAQDKVFWALHVDPAGVGTI